MKREDTRNNLLHFLTIDLQRGTTNEIIAIPLPPDRNYLWAVSPEGARIAFFVRDEVKGWSFSILSIQNKNPEYSISVPGWEEFSDVSWRPDGRALLMVGDSRNRSAVLDVQLNGKTTVLWSPSKKGRFNWIVNAVPSPDDRHIAVTVGILGASNAYKMTIPYAD